MTLRATAFHEAISVEKLEELFAAGTGLFAGTLAAKCPQCGTRFAVFFPAKDDPENDQYVTDLVEVIGRDCRAGKHKGEYGLSRTP